MKPYANIIAATILGAALVGASWVFSTAGHPVPAPTPPPASFVEQVRAAFPGDANDRRIKRAIAEQMILSLQADERAKKPRIKTTADLGQLQERVQYYRTGKLDPAAYAAVNQIVGAEVTRRLQLTGKVEPLTPAKRKAAKNFTPTSRRR